MMNVQIRAVIVEDEPHARANLREFSQDVQWLTVIGEAADGAGAVQLIDELKPDLIFLDVSLPEVSGLEVVERIRHKPEIVFTTAHDQFALAAFEIGALDYLLKPFGRDRFRLMVDRVRQRIQPSVAASERARNVFATPLRRVFARTHDEIVPIEVRNIHLISASGDYLEVHTDAGTHLLRMSLTDLGRRLDPERFRQIHRSHIVNLDAVVKLVPFDSRRLLVELRDGRQILASRAASELLRAESH